MIEAMTNLEKSNTIYFATGNQGKLKTMQDHISDFGFKVIQEDLPLIEPQANTSKEVALSKAKQAFAILKKPVAVMDASFHINQLNDFPGPYIKYVLDTIGIEGILSITQHLTNRACYFEEALVYIDSNQVTHAFVDKSITGVLADKPHISQTDRAWSALDRIFMPDIYQRPLATLNATERKVMNQNSVFTQFGRWLERSAGLIKREPRVSSRL